MAVSAGLHRMLRGTSDSSALAVLSAAAQRDNVRSSEIANALGLYQSSITRQVHNLEDAGHVTLVEDPADRRSCFIQITDSGRREFERLNQIGLERFAQFVDGWDAAEVRELTRLMSRLSDAVHSTRLRENAPVGRHWQGRNRT
jgi:DNA-binding MarR family transcriptional regulator